MKLIDARRAAGMTQAAVVAELRSRGFGTSQGLLSHWERIGTIKPDARVALSEILGVDVESRPTPMILRAINLLENEGYTVTKAPK